MKGIKLYLKVSTSIKDDESEKLHNLLRNIPDKSRILVRQWSDCVGINISYSQTVTLALIQSLNRDLKVD